MWSGAVVAPLSATWDELVREWMDQLEVGWPGVCVCNPSGLFFWPPFVRVAH
ncbi:hypothetical protein B0H10DRAFT_1040864 [Mycena sp. CBHHK59/15]|nr:hypothetical protein B0H10DRAFT_1040864 [Mycena sp. CBHHK59/15]